VAMDVDQDWGPSVEGRGRRRRRPLRLLLGLVLLAALVVVAVLLLVSWRIPRVPVDGLASPGSPMHVLVVGSDSREGLTPAEQRELSTGGNEIGGDRTDTIFVMTVQGADVALLAFPRDLWVRRCDGSMGRINVAQSIGGPACLVTTVRELSGIDVQHHVTVTFGGFRDIVDAVGGVQLCLEAPISDRDAGIDLPAGCQVLDGTDALGFVRVRKIDDDLQRIERQQQFLRALASEIAEPSTLLNPVRVVTLAEEAGDAVTVSRGTGVTALARLGLATRGLAAGDAATFTVPSEPGTTDGGASVLYVREAEAEALFARFRDGSVLQASGSGAITPNEVRVRVLNGAGISGLAGEVGELLEARGFQVVEVGNAGPRETTVVRYPPGRRPEAQLVSGEVPGGAELEETTQVSIVTLVLGRDAASRG
jgi:LCP family protein required for cell wall assembly